MGDHNWRNLQDQLEDAITADRIADLVTIAEQAREWLRRKPDECQRLDWLLHVAATYRHRLACQTLLDIGADPNAANEESGPCLHAAIMNGDADLLRFFISAGADLEATPEFNDGQNVPVTPLIYAAQRRAGDLLDILLNAGANPNGAVPAMTRDAETVLCDTPGELAHFRFARRYYLGRTVYYEAFNDDALLPVSSSAQCEIVARLIAAGADLALDVECYALQRAILLNRNDTVRLLLEHGSATHGKNEDGQSPLFTAAITRKTEIVQTLIAHGATLATDEHDLVTTVPERIRDLILSAPHEGSIA